MPFKAENKEQRNCVEERFPRWIVWDVALPTKPMDTKKPTWCLQPHIQKFKIQELKRKMGKRGLAIQ